MTHRTYKYFYGPKHIFFFGKKVDCPFHHWKLRRKISKMSTVQYIQWKIMIARVANTEFETPGYTMVKTPFVLEVGEGVDLTKEREYKDVLRFSVPDNHNPMLIDEIGTIAEAGESWRESAGNVQVYDRSKFNETLEELGKAFKVKSPDIPINEQRNMYIHAHLMMLEVSEEARYRRTVHVVKHKQCGYAQAMIEYHDWLMPRLDKTNFMIVGKNDLYAVPFSEFLTAEKVFTTEFKEIVNDSYRKLHELIKAAKPQGETAQECDATDAE